LGLFFMKNPLNRLKSFFLVEIWWKFTSERNPRGTHTWQPWSNLFTAPCFFEMNSFTKVLQSIESFHLPDWVKTRVCLQFCDMKILEFFWVQKLAKFVDFFTWKQICPKISQSFDHKNDKLCWTNITGQRYSLSIQEKILTISFTVFQKCTGK
jgi:hypothetical protein